MQQRSQLQPKDSRNFFMLPQAPEESGYYVYGTPGKGAFQYAHPSMMTVLLWVEREWAAIDTRKFGIGNISKAGGIENEHASHMDGRQVDIRAIRKDGLQVPVTWHDSDYESLSRGALMKKLLSMAGICILTVAYAGNERADWSENYRPLDADYLIYSGEPGERAAPTKRDRKIAIVVKGDPAKAIFDSLYPDAKGVSCTTEKGERLRRKGDVWCSFRPSNGYRCFMGFDLRTGQPHSGASC